MALSLGVSVGERISVGDSMVRVKAIKNPKLMVVTVNGGPDITVNDNKAEAVEILPGIRLFTGQNKSGSDSSRLLFDAPKSIPIHRVGKEKGQSEPKVDAHKAKHPQRTVGVDALFLNGVYEDTLDEILRSQKGHSGQHHYLQPYKSARILLFVKSAPTPENPITLYLSVTKPLNLVSYRAKVVQWQNKRDLTPTERAYVNQRIQKFQHSEGEVYFKTEDGKECVNLISIVNLERLEFPFPISCLIKTKDGMPLKNRERAGGWVPVQEAPEWLGTIPQVVLEDVENELAAGVAKSSKDSPALRQQRLANAPKLPEVIQVISRAYRRNADVIVEVRRRANGTCEACHKPAPFLRASDSEPFLEVHHRIMLSEGGEDTVENALALCPNCHRKLHFGKNDSPNAALPVTHLIGLSTTMVAPSTVGL